MSAAALRELAERTERFAARRMGEAQHELKLALAGGDAARLLAATLQLRYARSDLRRAVHSAATAAAKPRAVRR